MLQQVMLIIPNICKLAGNLPGFLTNDDKQPQQLSASLTKNDGHFLFK